MKSLFLDLTHKGGMVGGAALTARKRFGAIYGQARGLQGNSYAIVTKELRRDHRAITLDDVKKEVDIFINFAKDNTSLTFFVVELGCNLAYFTVEEISILFRNAKRLPNVYLPKRFLDNLETGFTI